MKKLAFVTSEEDPTLIKDDQLAIAPLQKLGYSVAPLVWDRPTERVDAYDALIFRSCWNYHRKLDLFLTWMKSVADLGIPTFNSMDINLWNLSKKYLLELRAKGAPVPATEWVAKDTNLDLAQVKFLIEKSVRNKL